MSKVSDRPKGMKCRLNEDGSLNSNYVDLLDEDRSVAGQKFVCVSFLSPEKILKERASYNFNEFVKQWDMSKSLSKFTQFLSFISYKYNLKFDDISKDLEDFCKDERDNIFNTTLEDEYKSFMDANEKRLEEKFNHDNKFQTSVRGIKIRGSYPSQEEAELRCKMLREVDPNHDVFVGPVGMWMPFHPEAYKTGRVEYLEDELNQLMNEKQTNEQQAKVEFDNRLRESKEKAIEDNKKKALESGNLLTQTLNDSGELVGVNNVNSLESGLGENATMEEVRKELFEDKDVVINKEESKTQDIVEDKEITDLQTKKENTSVTDSNNVKNEITNNDEDDGNEKQNTNHTDKESAAMKAEAFKMMAKKNH